MYKLKTKNDPKVGQGFIKNEKEVFSTPEEAVEYYKTTNTEFAIQSNDSVELREYAMDTYAKAFDNVIATNGQVGIRLTVDTPESIVAQVIAETVDSTEAEEKSANGSINS